MSIKRIIAILYQELYITQHSMETIFDVFIWALIQLGLFGFLSLYLAGSKNSLIAKYLLLGMVLWEVIRLIQYSISMGSLWNIWSRNLSNMFISPLTPLEFLLGFTISGIIKACIVLTGVSILAYFLFGFSILQIGIFNIILSFINLSLFAFALGIVIMGLIFRFGTRIQAFAWSVVPVLQPLSAAFYPLKILPYPLQLFAHILPSTYVFEAARQNLLDSNTIFWQLHITAFVENLFYVILAVVVFNYLFKGSKESGQFARNES